jgi:hypothetical protein
LRDEIGNSVVPWQFDSSSCSTVGVLPMLRREAAVERAIGTVGAERSEGTVEGAVEAVGAVGGAVEAVGAVGTVGAERSEGTVGRAVEAVGAVGAVVIHCPDGASF